jgi:hypothetical protein
MDRDHAGPKRFGKSRAFLLACRVGVQHRVQALPLAEQLQGRRAATGPAQSQTRHAPLLQREQIERTLDHADTASIATGMIPTHQRLGTGQPEVAGQIIGRLQ